MIVPKYWAQATMVTTIQGKMRTVKRSGWSSDSQELAEAHALERTKAAAEQLESGNARMDFTEKKLPYNGAEGVPIREEIISEHGDVVITRNSYGARCLNTPNVLFADIDFEKSTGRGFFWHAAVPLFILAFIFAWWLKSGLWLIVLLCAALFNINTLSKKLHEISLSKNGGVEVVALNRLKKFMEDNPSWGIRVYKTPAGLRLLATHKTFDPLDPEVTLFFQAIDADPLYVMMCKNQRCFRARLSAKPWRAGITHHMRPWPGVWPIRSEMLPIRVKWIQEYELVASNFAACRYQESLGNNVVDHDVQPVMDLHDAMSKAHTSLPLA